MEYGGKGVTRHTALAGGATANAVSFVLIDRRTG